jgi:hypothetical protein
LKIKQIHPPSHKQTPNTQEKVFKKIEKPQGKTRTRPRKSNLREAKRKGRKRS